LRKNNARFPKKTDAKPRRRNWKRTGTEEIPTIVVSVQPTESPGDRIGRKVFGRDDD
jgi:hypothetical protein